MKNFEIGRCRNRPISDSGIMSRTFTMPLSFSIRRALTVVAILGMFTLNGHTQTTPAARQLLDSMVQALGGKEFLEVKEIQTKGRFYSFRRGVLAAADLYSDYIKFPDMERLELGREKEKIIQINHGTEGWTINQSAPKDEPPVQEQSSVQAEEFLNNFKTNFDYMVRFVAPTPKASLVASGAEVVDFRRTDVLEVRDAEKNLMRIFVDRETRLPLKTQTRRTGEAIVHEEVYANWHRFDGVMTPLMLVRYRDGVKVIEIRAESVSYNPGLSDTLFAPPDSSKSSSK